MAHLKNQVDVLFTRQADNNVVFVQVARAICITRLDLLVTCMCRESGVMGVQSILQKRITITRAQGFIWDRGGTPVPQVHRGLEDPKVSQANPALKVCRGTQDLLVMFLLYQ